MHPVYEEVRKAVAEILDPYKLRRGSMDGF